MSAAHSDRNLLFGVLALQMDFLVRDALIAALHAWVLDKTKPLGEILVAQQALRPDERDVLDALVQKHLDHHRGDIEKSLAAVAVPTPLRDELHSLADADVQASLARLPTPSRPAEPRPLPATVAEVKTAAGLRYQILRPHDKGGIGEVFVALDQELNRQVALKEIQERHAGDPHSLGRFVREAEITGGLEHPGIVPVYGLGQYADGRPFYAMRFIQGETLKDAIAKFHAGDPAVTLRGLLTRFVAVCNTIAYAHSRGVIHRDLKPSNIMLGKYGETLVVDWGLAKAGVNEPARSVRDGLPEPSLVPSLADGIETQAGAAMGTPAYMSPEQATGLLELLGPASDIYSLGATLYTLLTGRPPIEGKNTADVLRKAQRGEWLPPRQVKPDVPPALAAVCQKAMTPLPSARYATALDLAADVERWLADDPVAVYREPWAVRSRRWMRRHRTLVSTAVGTLVVALLSATAGLVIVSDAWDKESVAHQTAENEKETTRNQKEKAEQQKKEADRRREQARFNEYVATMNLVQREYEANNIGHVRELLEAQVPRTEDEKDWRNFEWYYWQHMTHRETLTLMGEKQVEEEEFEAPENEILSAYPYAGSSGVDSFSLGMVYSPDGRRIAAVCGDKRVRIWDTTTGKELFSLKGHTDTVKGLSFSPDGRWLASAGDTSVRVWDTATGKELRTLNGDTRVLGVSFSPDGRRLAAAGSDGTVLVWDAATGKELLTLKANTDDPVMGLSFSPDSRRLAAAVRNEGLGEGKVRIWDVTTGKQLITIGGLKYGVNGVSFSPDGWRLAIASDQMVGFWDATSGKALLSLDKVVRGAWTVVFSPDGRLLASAGGRDLQGDTWDRRVRVWDVASGKELLDLQGHTGPVGGLAFSPDGWMLASVGWDKTVRVWGAVTGKELLDLRKQGAWEFESVSFSPDGRRLASASNDHTVRVWDAATGKELLTLKGHTDGVSHVTFSPDGRWLASASGGSDGTVRVWDATTGKELLTLKGHSVWGEADLSFSPDGRRLAAAGSDGTVLVWDAATGKELFTLKGNTNDSVMGVSFSPDGQRVAAASHDKMVHVWDAATGKELLTLKGHTGWVWHVTFSPDGRQLASTSDDHTVRVWDAASGNVLLTLEGHTGRVSHVSFSPDGRRLASASGDRTVRVWDAASGKELLILKSHMAEVTRVSFSPNGRRLAAVIRQDVGPGWENTGQGEVRIWETLPIPDTVWRQRCLVGQVDLLFEELGLREEVLANLRKNLTLNEADRKFSLEVALSHSEDSWNLDGVARSAVTARDAGKEAYARALRQAEVAVRMVPGTGHFLNTLGIAQYRTGHFADALATLTKSEKIKGKEEDSHPADLAFLAMTQHQLGKKDEAKAMLARLRTVMKHQIWVEDTEAVAFLREAEELIEGKAKDKKP